MIVVVCIPCELAIRIMPTCVGNGTSAQEVQQLVGTHSEYWPDKFPCVKCGKSARGMLEREADPRALKLMELRDLTPHEAFAAFNGLGLPEEQRCSLEAVQALLIAQPVRRVVGTDIRGCERTIIDSLELQDGTVVHFGAGAEGACIYRIVRPGSATQRALTEGGTACP